MRMCFSHRPFSQAYSDSMPNVTPSAALARGELTERNGWFLRRAAAAGRTQARIFRCVVFAASGCPVRSGLITVHGLTFSMLFSPQRKHEALLRELDIDPAAAIGSTAYAASTASAAANESLN